MTRFWPPITSGPDELLDEPVFCFYERSAAWFPSAGKTGLEVRLARG